MGFLDVLLGRPSARAVTVYNYEGQDLGIPCDLVVNGRKREVALFRPPVVLGPGGESLPGVDRQLVADYLVSTTGMLAEVVSVRKKSANNSLRLKSSMEVIRVHFSLA